MVEADLDEIGYCDYCGAPHNVGAIADHCPDCGQCYEHCECQPRRTPDGVSEEYYRTLVLGEDITPEDAERAAHPGTTI